MVYRYLGFIVSTPAHWGVKRILPQVHRLYTLDDVEMAGADALVEAGRLAAAAVRSPRGLAPRVISDCHFRKNRY